MTKTVYVILFFGFLTLPIINSFSFEDWLILTNGNEVQEIVYDSQSNILWSASLGGLLKWDISTKKETKFTTKDGLTDNRLYQIAIGPDRTVWALGERLEHYDGSKFQSFDLYPLNDKSKLYYIKTSGSKLNQDLISEADLEVTKNGIVWISLNGSLASLGLDGKLYLDPFMKPKIVGQIAVDQNNLLYAWVLSEGLYVKKEGNWHLIPATQEFAPAWIFVSDILAIEESEIWLSSYYDGVVQIKDGKKYSFLFGETPQDNEIVALARDNSGRIWADIYYYDGEEWKSITSIKDWDSPVRGITSLSAGPSSKVFLSHSKNGIMLLPDLVNLYANDILMSNKVNDITVKFGHAWFATDFGVQHLRVQEFTAEYFETNLLNAKKIFMRDTTDVFIGFAGRGLAHYQNGNWKYYSVNEGLDPPVVAAITGSPDSSIWIGNQNGLFKWANDTISFVEGSERFEINAMAFNPPYELYIGGKNVLMIYDTRARVFKPVPGIPLQPQFSISSIFVSNTGSIAVAVKNVGLFTKVPGNEEWFFFGDDVVYGMSQITCLAMDSLGGFWHGTTDGAILFENNQFKKYNLQNSPLVDEKINDIEVCVTGCIAIATDAGINCLTRTPDSVFPFVVNDNYIKSVKFNPIKSELIVHLDIELQNLACVKLFNIKGELIEDRWQSLSNNSILMKLKSPISDVYFIKIKEKDKIYSKQIILFKD